MLFTFQHSSVSKTLLMIKIIIYTSFIEFGACVKTEIALHMPVYMERRGWHLTLLLQKKKKSPWDCADLQDLLGKKRKECSKCKTVCNPRQFATCFRVAKETRCATKCCPILLFWALAGSRTEALQRTTASDCKNSGLGASERDIGIRS